MMRSAFQVGSTSYYIFESDIRLQATKVINDIDISACALPRIQLVLLRRSDQIPWRLFSYVLYSVKRA